MKYDDEHKPEFVGASGTCETCGLSVTLEYGDSPKQPVKGIWIVKCPHCNTEIQCEHSG